MDVRNFHILLLTSSGRRVFSLCPLRIVEHRFVACGMRVSLLYDHKHNVAKCCVKLHVVGVPGRATQLCTRLRFRPVWRFSGEASRGPLMRIQEASWEVEALDTVGFSPQDWGLQATEKPGHLLRTGLVHPREHYSNQQCLQELEVTCGQQFVNL